MTQAAAARRRSWLPAYIGLGSNLQDPSAQLQTALLAMAGLPDCRLIAVSDFYATPPMGPAGQPEYVNAAAGMLTQLQPARLLAALKAIERTQGRPLDSPRWGPRIIDLDIIAMGELCCNETGLRIPHAGAAQRNFVLRPLADLAPALELPGAGRVDQLLARLGEEGLRRLPPIQ